MRAIYQGESANFVIRPRLRLPEDYTVEAAIVGPSGNIVARFSTEAASEDEKIVVATNRLMSFELLPTQTARMCGKYRVEIRIVCADSIVIRNRWAICIHRSALGHINT